MLKMKRPCKDCPFIKNGQMNQSLHPDRMKEIVKDLHLDGIFRCHKTLNYNLSDDNGNIPFEEDNQFCAGSLVYMDKCGKHNMPMQVAIRLGWLDPSQLAGHDEVIDPLPISDFGVYFGRKGAQSPNN